MDGCGSLVLENENNQGKYGGDVVLLPINTYLKRSYDHLFGPSQYGSQDMQRPLELAVAENSHFP